MIRDLTKSALSLSWALSLLGAEQTINAFRPGQQNQNDMFAPMAQAAASQLDESMKGLYRTGDTMQRGMVDMAFSLFNPAAWINSSTWTNMAGALNPSQWGSANGSTGRGMASMMNLMNWINPDNFRRNMNNVDPFGGPSQQTAQPAGPSPSGTAGSAVGASPANEDEIADWGPMPSNS